MTSALPSSNVLATLTYLLTSGFIPSLDLDSDTSLLSWSQSTSASLKNIESSPEAASRETTNPELMLCDFVAKLTSHLELRGYPIGDFIVEGNVRPSSAKSSPQQQPVLTSILKKPSSSSPEQQDVVVDDENQENSSSPTKTNNKSINQSTTLLANHFATVKNSFPIKGGAQLLRHGNDVARVSRMAQRLAEEVADLQQAKIRMTSQHAQELNQQAASYRDIISELLEQQAKIERQLSEEMSKNRILSVATANNNNTAAQLSNVQSFNFGAGASTTSTTSNGLLLNRMNSASSPIRF